MMYTLRLLAVPVLVLHGLRTSYAAAGLVLLLIGCSGASYTPNPGPRTVTFEPGAPNFDMLAVATVREGAPGVDLYLNVPPASLSYVKTGAGFQGGYELLVRVYARGDRVPVQEQTWVDTLRARTYAETQRFEVRSRAERLRLPPGRYRIEASLEDAESEAKAVRRQEVEVFAADDGEPTAAALRLVGRQGAAPFEPIVSMHVPARYDSMRVVTELYAMPADAAVALRLLRFESDTTVAVPPHWFTPGRFTLRYIGVDFGEADTLQRSRRLLAEAVDHATLEFTLPPLDPGSYRVELTAHGPGDAEKPLIRRRYEFTMMSPDFPRVTTIEEMVEALAYIAREREMEEMRGAETPAEMRARFDAFWGRLVPNREAAADAVERYFSRVEEANVRYSNFKPGWKTDRGMIYILFGSPAYEDVQFQRLLWQYYRGSFTFGAGSETIFQFTRALPYGADTPFEHFILNRGQVYEEPWRDVLERWRDGEAL